MSIGSRRYSAEWGPRQDAVLMREWENLSTKELSLRLGCSTETVLDHAERLGLRKREVKRGN